MIKRWGDAFHRWGHRWGGTFTVTAATCAIIVVTAQWDRYSWLVIIWATVGIQNEWFYRLHRRRCTLDPMEPANPMDRRRQNDR